MAISANSNESLMISFLKFSFIILTQTFTILHLKELGKPHTQCPTVSLLMPIHPAYICQIYLPKIHFEHVTSHIKNLN